MSGGKWEWLPMDTAPTDGTAVIVKTAYHEVLFAYFDDGTDADGDPVAEPSWYWFDQNETGQCDPIAWTPKPDAVQ